MQLGMNKIQHHSAELRFLEEHQLISLNNWVSADVMP